MYLRKLKIRNFRNLNELDFKFNSLINYLYSPNGVGKTNILEAIQCISVGKSLRANAETEIFELGNQNRQNPILVRGDFEDDELEFSQTYSLENYPRKKKTLLINKTKTSIHNYIGRVPSVWFSPESIKIISSSPKTKRKYFDDILIQLYPEYLFDMRYYNRALKQRNRLLQDEIPNPTQMKVWTEQLLQYGSKLIKTRQKFFSLLNQYFNNLNEIERYKFRVDFLPNIELDDIFDEDAGFAFRQQLRNRFTTDKKRMTTTSGPHKDDWKIFIQVNEDTTYIDAEKYASRGQQRMSLIILQLVLIKIFQNNLEKNPILLLDDIFSELDKENEEILLSFIKRNNIQTFITGVEEKKSKNIAGFYIKDLITKQAT